MGKKPLDIVIPIQSETIKTFDQAQQKWEYGYRRNFRRQKINTFLDAVLFNEAAEAFTSKIFECRPYVKFTILINLIVASDPTDIVFHIEFSDDQENWYKYMNGPFGDLRYEDSAGNKKEYIVGDVIAPYVRIRAVSSGCEATKTFLITAKMIFNS